MWVNSDFPEWHQISPENFNLVLKFYSRKEESFSNFSMGDIKYTGASNSPVRLTVPQKLQCIQNSVGTELCYKAACNIHIRNSYRLLSYMKSHILIAMLD